MGPSGNRQDAETTSSLAATHVPPSPYLGVLTALRPLSLMDLDDLVG